MILLHQYNLKLLPNLANISEGSFGTLRSYTKHNSVSVQHSGRTILTLRQKIPSATIGHRESGNVLPLLSDCVTFFPDGFSVILPIIIII
jgi:hypothetical protein